MAIIWQYIFLEEGRPLLYAFLFLLLAAPSFGTIGIYVSLKNYNSSIGTIAHASLLGLGLSKYAEYYWNWNYFTVFTGMLLVANITAVILFWVESHQVTRQTIRPGTLLNMLWSIGMAIGILLLQKVPGGASIHSYLWGSIFIIQEYQLWALAGLNLIVFLTLILPWRHQQLLIFDKDFAQSRGMNIKIYTFIFYILISNSVILLISAVGILLCLGLFSIPCAIANLFAHNLKQMLLYSCGFLLLSSWLGLWLSIETNTTPSSFIIIFLTLTYIFLAIGKYLYLAMKHTKQNQILSCCRNNK